MSTAMTKRYRYSLWQDGMKVAAVDAPTLEDAQREIMHYAMMYSQDGPCEIRGKHLATFRRAFKTVTVGSDR